MTIKPLMKAKKKKQISAPSPEPTIARGLFEEAKWVISHF
jgi:hypothetical protein